MSQLPPAGWHPDPLGRHAQRYWDGNEWTEHVADTAGNMTTDPLNLGGAQAAQDTGQAQASGETAQVQEDHAAGWGESTLTGQGSQGSSDAWATTAAAAGGAVAVEQAATEEPAAEVHDAADTTTVDEGDPAPAAHDEPAAAVTLDDLDGDHGDEVDAGPRVMESTDGTVALAAADGAVVVRTDAVIATSGVAGTPVDDTEVFDGDGDVWVGRAGTFASVIEIEGGLVVSNAHLVAWSADDDPTETSSGIAGFDGRAFGGQGYVVVATGSGLVLADAAHGVQVRSGRLIAHTAGLDVQHGEHVDLHGEGTVFAAAG